MRKCEKCGASMKLDLRLKVNGGGYGIVVRVDEKQKATTIDDVRVKFLHRLKCLVSNSCYI